MSSNQHPGTSSDRMSNAVVVLEYPSAWVGGSDTNDTTDSTDDNRIDPDQNLADFSLGPC